MITTKKEKTIYLMFSQYGYILKVKLNNKWQMSIILEYLCVVNEIALLTALYQVKNFKSCNKYFHFFTKKKSIVTKNILVITFALQLDEVLKNWKLIKLIQLVHKNKV